MNSHTLPPPLRKILDPPLIWSEPPKIWSKTQLWGKEKLANKAKFPHPRECKMHQWAFLEENGKYMNIVD